MRVLEYEATLPFPAARLELSLGTRDEPVAQREYAMVIDVLGSDGASMPKAQLNWGYSAPLGGCYQYVPPADARDLAEIAMPVVTELPIGAIRVRVVPWKPIVRDADPFDAFDRLLLTFSTAIADRSAPAPGARFSTVRRSDRG